MANVTGGTNGGNETRSLQKDVQALATTIARLDSQLATLSTQVSGLSARFDEQVGQVSMVSSTIGRADWKTVTAVGALLLGLWQFAIRPLESAVAQVRADETATAQALDNYKGDHDRISYSANARQDTELQMLRDAMPTRRLATLEAQVAAISEQMSRRWEEMIKNAENRGATRAQMNKEPSRD